MTPDLKILFLESYYSGSHKQWLDGLVQNCNLDITTITLPGRHWKWRMESSAYKFAEEYVKLNQSFDLIITTGITNLSLFKSLASTASKPLAPCYLYLHETQMCYPWKTDGKDISLGRDRHYSFIELMNCITADKIFFNSKFHHNYFFESLSKFIKPFPENYFQKEIPVIENKSAVLPIALNLTDIPTSRKTKSIIPVLLWNHRWEYDKNPELFFETLMELQAEGLECKLIIAGEQFKLIPDIFNKAKDALADNIIHYGYAHSREEYIDLLMKSDILPVTSKHDFFGVSVVEAIAAGIIPLLPNRLAYPEHINSKTHPDLFYDSDQQFRSKLRNLIHNHIKYSSLRRDVMKYDWVMMKKEYLENFVL